VFIAQQFVGLRRELSNFCALSNGYDGHRKVR